MALVESSRLWTTGGAGDGASTYTRDNMAEMFRNMLLSDFTTQGVLNGLAVSGTASPLTLATGAACVYGFLHFCTTSGTMAAITTPSVGTTGLHVVLRADWTAQTVRVVPVRNTDGNSATPALTQTAGTTWEIRLATGTITTAGVISLTDARQFVASPSSVLTNGRVPIVGANGRITDDSNLVWDNAAKRLGVGTASPGKAIDVGTGQIQISSGLALPLRARQGGSATDWNSDGSSTQTLTAPREQVGSATVTAKANWAGTGTAVAITFPVAFSAKPLVYLSVDTSTSAACAVRSTGTTASGTSIIASTANGTDIAISVSWRAIGPE